MRTRRTVVEERPGFRRFVEVSYCPLPECGHHLDAHEGEDGACLATRFNGVGLVVCGCKGPIKSREREKTA